MNAAALAPVACRHCGTPVPGAPATDEPVFCCPGCRAVHHALTLAGLGDFYSLRDRLGDEDRPAPVDADALAAADAAYAHFDDPELLARYATPEGIRLHLQGVHCAACIWVLDQLPRLVPGVVESRLDFARGVLHLRWDPARVRLSTVAARLHGLGYPSTPLGVEAENARRKQRRGDMLRLGVAFALMGNVMLLAAAHYAGADAGLARFFEWLMLGLTLPQVTYGAWPFYKGAIAGMRARVAHMDLPIALGLIGGYVASVISTVTGGTSIYYDSVATLVFLLLGGRYLQQRGQESALKGADLLDCLAPPIAWRRSGAEWKPVPTAHVAAGDRVRVRMGEVFPVDGVIAEGDTRVDESALTGESRPVRAVPGAHVWTGTRNVGADVEVTVESTGADTRVGRLLSRIEGADAQRAPIMRHADRIAGVFVLAVIGLAVVGGLVWWRIDPTRVFDVVVALLVISCPCALGLATPLALAVARGRAARNGLIVRSTAALERLARVRTVVLDKTGTITEGRLNVESATFEGDEAWLARAVVALEARATHPLARAIVAWGPMPDGAVTDFAEHPGRGVEGVVDGRRVAVGSPAWLAPEGPIAMAAREAAERARTPIAVALDGEPVGLVVVSDRPRPEAPAVVAALRGLGLELKLRSGDHPAVVADVAARLGVEDAVGGASPERKASDVTGETPTAMVGDGLNDAPALRAADVGIAVAGGAEAALRVADVYLRGGLAAAPALFEGARRTLRSVKLNLLFSLAYNLTFATLALTGHIPPLVAAIIMPVSSLTVVAASLLAKTFPTKA
jgi:Cu2+-exporting ATPase